MHQVAGSPTLDITVWAGTRIQPRETELRDIDLVGPAIRVIGIGVPSVDGAVNAVSPHARAVLKVRVRPERDSVEAQEAVMDPIVTVLAGALPHAEALATRAATTDPSTWLI